MKESLMQQGTDLMIFGMGTVFVFLTLLVLGTILMSRFIQSYLSEPELAPSSKRQSKRAVVPDASIPPSVAADHGVDARILKVIEAAVRVHRQ